MGSGLTVITAEPLLPVPKLLLASVTETIEYVVVDAGGRFLVQAQQADCEALTGNMAPKGSSFGEICFKDTFVDEKLIENTFFGGLLKVFSSILK